MGADAKTVRNWITGKTSPQVFQLIMLEAEGVDAWYVLTGFRSPSRMSPASMAIERRKLELVASYVEWCRQSGEHPLKAFGKFCEAYNQCDPADADLPEKVSSIDTVDPQYLSELYGVWIMERPARFKLLTDLMSVGTGEMLSTLAEMNEARDRRMLEAFAALLDRRESKSP